MTKSVGMWGHQAYPHKLITGRYSQFHTLAPEGRGRGLSQAQRKAPLTTSGRGQRFHPSISAALGHGPGPRSRRKTITKWLPSSVTGAPSTGGMALEAIKTTPAHLPQHQPAGGAE